MSDSLWPCRQQHTRFPCLPLSPGICSNSCPLSPWWHPTISSSLMLFSCPQSLPASKSFPVSQLFASNGQSIGALASVLPMSQLFASNGQSIGALASVLLMSQLFASNGQSIGALASVLLMNIHGWFPLGLIGLISFQSEGLSRVFSSTTIRKH